MAKLSPSARARRRGWLLPLRGSRALRTVLGVSVALLQAFFLVDAIRLHAHGWADFDGVVGLPADYHNHDFEVVPDRGVETVDAHECLGCRLERTGSLPTLVPAGVPSVTRPAQLLPAAASFSLSPVWSHRLPRAPPHA